MYAMNIQNDVIGLVLRQYCKSKQMTDFIAWPSRCHVTIYILFIFLAVNYKHRYCFSYESSFYDR
jgi:hypothetical protein